MHKYLQCSSVVKLRKMQVVRELTTACLSSSTTNLAALNIVLKTPLNLLAQLKLIFNFFVIKNCKLHYSF